MEILIVALDNCKNSPPGHLIEKPILLNFEQQINSALDAVANELRILLGTDWGELTGTKLESIC